EVGEVDGDHDVRFDGAAGRQPAGGEGVVGELDEGVGLLLGAGAPVTLRAGGLHDGLQGGADLLPADGVQLAGEAPAAVQVPGEAQPPALGRIGFVVGVQRLPVVADHGDQPVVGLL